MVDKNHSEIFENATKEDEFEKRIQEVEPLKVDVETKNDETVLYVNENFDNKEDKQG